MSHPECEELLRNLLEDAGLAALLKRSRDDYLGWDEFLRMELPAGMSPLGTWELLTALHRSEAIPFPAVHPGARYWYVQTHAIGRHLSTIDRMCGPDSHLLQAVTAASGRPFLVKSRIGDTFAAAQMDGLDVSGEDVRALLHLKHAPRDDVERLLVNTMRALEELPNYIDRPFSSELMHELRLLLLDGLSSSSLPRTDPALGLIRAEDISVAEEVSVEEKTEYICRYANNESGDPHDHPAVRAAALGDFMKVHHPLPDMNNQVGRLMARLYTLKNGLPLLGLLPITKAQLMWERGESPYDRLSVGRQSYLKYRETNFFDSTLYVTVLLEVVVVALLEFERAMIEAERSDEAIKKSINVGPGLNHRQRSILGRAIRNPDAEFRIGYHKTNHGVTYATARKDLVGLVEAGYLECDRRGHAFVFRPCPGINDRLGVRSADNERALQLGQ